MKRAITLLLILVLTTPQQAEAIAGKDAEANRYDTIFYDSADALLGDNVPSLAEADMIRFPAFTGDKITPTGVVLHWTGGRESTVENFVSAIRSNKACGEQGCSVQLFISTSGQVYQLVDDLATYTEHAAYYNSCCIGIEIAGRGEADLMGNPAQKQKVAATVAYLMQKYHIPLVTDVQGKKGVLSHHIVNPGRKSDVGDNYLANIKTMLTAGGTGGAQLPADLNANQQTGIQLASARGFAGGEGPCLIDLWTRESSWNQYAINDSKDAWRDDSQAYKIDTNKNHRLDPGEGPVPDVTEVAYGIPQAKPGPKMLANGGDWRTNPETQIKWGLDYIAGRYRTPCNAIVWHNSHGWY